MPRAMQPPIVQVLKFFETASLDACEIALALAKEKLAKRRPASTEGDPPVTRKRRVVRRGFKNAPTNEATPLVPQQSTVGE